MLSSFPLPHAAAAAAAKVKEATAAPFLQPELLVIKATREGTPVQALLLLLLLEFCFRV
jgi:hypothetical protein